jgi:hypothetical protein
MISHLSDSIVWPLSEKFSPALTGSHHKIVHESAPDAALHLNRYCAYCHADIPASAPATRQSLPAQWPAAVREHLCRRMLMKRAHNADFAPDAPAARTVSERDRSECSGC